MTERIMEPNRFDRAPRKRLNRTDAFRNVLTSAAALLAITVGMLASQSTAMGQAATLSNEVSSAAPETCLSWYQWANPYNPDAASENAVDRIMAEPDVNKFCKDFTDKLGQFPALLVPDEAPPEIKDAVSTIAPQLVDAILRKQGCFFVESFELSDDQAPENFKIGLAFEIGDNANKTIESVRAMLQMAGAPMEAVAIGDQNAVKVIMPPDGLFSEIAFAQQDGFLVAATTTDMLQEIMGRMKRGQVAGWLGQMQAEQKYVRPSAIGKIDVAILRKDLMPLAGPDASKLIKALGFDNLERIEFSGGYDRADFAQRFKLKFDGTPAGIFAFDGTGLTENDIAHFPDDSFFAAAVSLDLKKAFDEFNSIMIQMDPRAAQNMARDLIQFQNETGVDLRKLIGTLGPTMTLHNGYGDGLFSGMQMRSKIQDPKWFEKTVEDFAILAARESRGTVGIDSIEQNGQAVKILRLGFAPVPVEPSWFMNGDQLTFALFPSSLGPATNPALAPQLIKADSFAPYLELIKSGPADSKVIGFSYFESKWAYEILYGYACIASAMGKNMDLEEFGVPMDFEQMAKAKAHWMDLQLPSCRSISKHLTPEVSIVRAEKDAIVFESHSTLANSNLTMAAPGVAIGMLLPAVQQVRAAARRTQSKNNLRQFALAALNYESAFMKFPSGDGPVKEGGPPVSWRVKILPFIEQNNLYDMYNFDEPWDSENNLKIAQQMPEFFVNPASNAPEGHTVYRGVGGISGVMGVRADGKSVSRGLAEITDGTSNTVMILEVPDEMAVPWTKPDYGIDPERVTPWQLLGNHRGGFNVVFCDGSTHFISTSIDADTFKLLLMMNDGEVTNF